MILLGSRGPRGSAGKQLWTEGCNTDPPGKWSSSGVAGIRNSQTENCQTVHFARCSSLGFGRIVMTPLDQDPHGNWRSSNFTQKLSSRLKRLPISPRNEPPA
eukprot:9490760-Pyramimonas_sp.AAC.1